MRASTYYILPSYIKSVFKGVCIPGAFENADQVFFKSLPGERGFGFIQIEPQKTNIHLTKECTTQTALFIYYALGISYPIPPKLALIHLAKE
ncbi:MAG: hypothetical protein KDD56_01285 [Bdellovibrionales bacterium]|nr:hypothetical protein [Bdellovibrionales bacterium]